MLVTEKAREQITVSSTAKTLTTTKFRPTAENYVAVYVDMQVLAHKIRVTFDGATAPVKDTTGKIWYVGQTYRVWGEDNMKTLQMIRDADSDAIVVCDYFGRPN